MRLPDFIIAGAPRCGTTWLSHLLHKHPDVHMAQPITPEPKFFLLDNLYENGIKYYSDKWFSKIGRSLICGEKSTNYMESPDTAKRIKTHLPDVKLIFILRNPITRAYSNYLWSTHNGFEAETFERALELENYREQLSQKQHNYARPHAYFSRGLYASHLKSYFDNFKNKQLLILQYEHIFLSPEKLSKDVYSFLQITPRLKDWEELGIINASPNLPPKMSKKTYENLKIKYADANGALKQLTSIDLDLWK